MNFGNVVVVVVVVVAAVAAVVVVVVVVVVTTAAGIAVFAASIFCWTTHGCALLVAVTILYFKISVEGRLLGFRKHLQLCVCRPV
jgi:hypothetical protein